MRGRKRYVLDQMARISETLLPIFGLVFFCCDYAAAQSYGPQKILGRYQQEVWRDEDGLPQNTVLYITQGPDGYLWLGTMGGVGRFDGVNFTVFDNANTPEIKSDLINALIPEPDGSIWIGTEAGLVRRDAEGRFTHITAPEGIDRPLSTRLERDGTGHLWVGKGGGGLFRWREGRFEVLTVGHGPPGDEIHTMMEDGEGGVWIGTSAGLARWKDGRFILYTAEHGLPRGFIRTLCRDRDGNLWIGTMGGGLTRFRDGIFTPFGAREGLPSDQVWALLADRDGTLWVGTGGAGIYQMRDGKFANFTSADGLPGDRVCSLFQSADGDIWIGTDGGLSRLREGRFRIYTKEDGLANDFTLAIYKDRAGALWAGSTQGVTRFRDGASTTFTMSESSPLGEITAIGDDAAGGIWIGASNGLNQLRGEEFVPESLVPGSPAPAPLITCIYLTRAGELLVGTRGAGTWVRCEEGWEKLSLPPAWAGTDVLAFYEDRAGNLWAGARDGGVGRQSASAKRCRRSALPPHSKEGEPWSAAGSDSATPPSDDAWQVWTTRDGLAADYAVSFYEDPKGSVWVGTFGGGLSRWQSGRWSSVSTRQGLFDNLVFQILPDDEDNLWMSCNRGLFRVSQQELDDCADGRIPFVTSYAYGTSDGLPSREFNSARPAGWRARDGQLFFPTTRGMISFPSRGLPATPPRVMIEQVQLDRAPVPASGQVSIGPAQNELEIRYTALSWNRPPQIKFKYQMAGLDDAWVDAGTRRTANYSHLPPGSYTFRVKADNGDGVWSTADATVAVLVSPPFWRTWWFFSLGALALAALVLGSFRLRVQQLQRKQAAQEAFSRHLMEAHESERRRIAAELHDSLGQSLAMIKNSAVFGAQGKGDGASAQAQFERITEQSAHAINEVREISYDLRPYLLDQFGLTKAIRALLDKIADSSALQITTRLDEVSDLFPPEVEMSLYRIVQESLNNILKHAAATEVEVTMEKTESSVRLEIRDNGKGFDPRAAKNGGRSGFGLLGISERVRLLGGTHTIRSAPGEGTSVRITLECGGRA